ncbi:TetR/AcrR family transcriptional regulator [Eupransor demetentiae]|uniref:AcrR family n=1 Tax=Eupransor demetentiae TaxID=3109584 RepID=A0ABM9N5A7_9LACO|nr:AcrR family [Lactobacillaceae bacterium LMG 33000]
MKVLHEETRQRILNAATELFLMDGYEQTTTREIAKKLDISQPALYHHFGDKETLFVEVIKKVGTEIQQEMKDILAQPYDDMVEELTDLTLVILTRHPRDVFTLIHGSFPSLSRESQRELGMAFGIDYVMPIQEFFEKSSLELNQDVDAKTAASFYITSLAPLFSDFHALTEDSSQRERIGQLLNLILFGAAKRP